MKILEIDYAKDNTAKKYHLVVLKELTDGYEGISIGEMPIDKQAEVVKIFTEFEQKLESYMVNYRRLSKNEIISQKLVG